MIRTGPFGRKPRRRAGGVAEDGRAKRHRPAPFLALIARPTGPGPRDRALTLAALAYAKALSSGLADPRRLFPIFTLRLNKTDLVAGLHAALQNSRIGPWLEGLAPQDADYQTLSAAYLDALQHVSDPISGRIPPGPLIRIGDSDPRVSAITTRLMHEGYPTSDESSAQPLGAIPRPQFGHRACRRPSRATRWTTVSPPTGSSAPKR